MMPTYQTDFALWNPHEECYLDFRGGTLVDGDTTPRLVFPNDDSACDFIPSVVKTKRSHVVRLSPTWFEIVGSVKNVVDFRCFHHVHLETLETDFTSWYTNGYISRVRNRSAIKFVDRAVALRVAEHMWSAKMPAHVYRCAEAGELIKVGVIAVHGNIQAFGASASTPWRRVVQANSIHTVVDPQ